MDPGLALSAVEYAIQLAQHIKHTVKAYHENPAQFENLLSRFRAIRRSLRIIKESNNVDFDSPVWGNAFRRIKNEFEKAASTLREIHHAIRSSPLQRLFHAKETSQKLTDLDEKIDALQRDLDILGFFTISNAASAHHSEDMIYNVQDVKACLLSLEARLESMEQKLQYQNSSKADRDRSLSRRDLQSNQDSGNETFKERATEYKERIIALYNRDAEMPRQRGRIVVNILALQARLRKNAASLIEIHSSDLKSTLLSESCENLLNQWLVDHSDVHFLPSNQMHRTERSVVYQGSMTIRGLWLYPVREARVAVKLVLGLEQKSHFDAVLQRISVLRAINHPNIVSFYGAWWPKEGDGRKVCDNHNNGSLRYALLVTELMTHNLTEAITLPALSTLDKKLKLLMDVARGVEYLHRRGIFRLTISTKHVMLRILQGEVVGNAKLSSLWSSYEEKRIRGESLYEAKDELKSRAPIYHEDTFKFGLLMCFVLSSRVDHSSWDHGVFTEIGSTGGIERVTELARSWVRGIAAPFLKQLAERCLFNNQRNRPSIKFIRKCIQAFLNKEPLPDLSTTDCGEEFRSKGKDFFYGKQENPACPEKAIPFFERAACCGNVAALVNLGNCHFYGLGTDRDVKMGFELFKAAAFAGNAAGQVKMGIYFHDGIPGTASAEIFLAAEMYRRAAIQGNVSAQFKLGCYKYNEEVGNPRNREEAAALWKLAASGGHRFAQFFLGRCFEEGCGLERDVTAARIWYARSAVQGHFGGKWALQRLSDMNPVTSAPLQEQSVRENVTQRAALNRSGGLSPYC